MTTLPAGRELDLEVDKAMGESPRREIRLSSWGRFDSVADNRPNRFTLEKAVERTPSLSIEEVVFPSRDWSTSTEAVGAMMEWLAAQGVWVVVQHTPDGAMDWSIIADTPCLGRSTSLPHALALAVVEVAKRAQSTAPETGGKEKADA